MTPRYAGFRRKGQVALIYFTFFIQACKTLRGLESKQLNYGTFGPIGPSSTDLSIAQQLKGRTAQKCGKIVVVHAGKAAMKDAPFPLLAASPQPTLIQTGYSLTLLPANTALPL